MNLYGIELDVKNVPKLDPGFIPLYKFNQAFLKTAKKPIALAVARADGVALPDRRRGTGRQLGLRRFRLGRDGAPGEGDEVSCRGAAAFSDQRPRTLR